MTQERKGKFTRGPVVVGTRGLLAGTGDDCFTLASVYPKWSPTAEENRANADRVNEDLKLIASAFNSATLCEDIGLNGQRCIEMLPEMLKILACLQSVDDYFLPGSGFTRDQMDAVFVKNGITAGTSVAELRNNLSQLLSKLKG